MSITPETARHRLRKLYRDAHHCDAPSDDIMLAWAEKPELWAEHKIRFGGWGFIVTEATVREAKQLFRRATTNLPLQQEQEQAE
jgi:hypothetical protein